MRTLVLADIHANFPAFEAVLADAQNWDRVLFLGDAANFGPHPKECVNLLRELDAECIMGNHDLAIATPDFKRVRWDEWSRKMLDEKELTFLASFRESAVFDGNILALHAAPVSFQLVPNTPPHTMKAAFSPLLTPSIKKVFFGHYHYEINAEQDGVSYHGIRAVGQQRDRDTRAGYSILEDGVLSHYRVPYDLEKTVFDTKKLDFLTEPFRTNWLELLETAFNPAILRHYLAEIEKNEKETDRI